MTDGSPLEGRNAGLAGRLVLRRVRLIERTGLSLPDFGPLLNLFCRDAFSRCDTVREALARVDTWSCLMSESQSQNTYIKYPPPYYNYYLTLYVL